MKAVLSAAFRVCFAVLLALGVLSVLRWGPVYAEPPWDVRALSLAGPALLAAVGAALTAGDRRSRPTRTLWAGLILALASLASVVGSRAPAGLVAHVAGARGSLGDLPAGPIDVVGDDLQSLPRVHRREMRWAGVVRAPESGPYRFWAAGDGSVVLDLDGVRLLSAEGAPLRAGKDVALYAGEHVLAVTHRWTGPGAHFSVGWTRPRDRSRTGGLTEVIPPRYLGPPTSALAWRMTDLLSLAIAGLAGVLALVIPWDRLRRLPLPRAPGRAEFASSLVGHAFLACLMSWPLVTGLATVGVVDRVDGRLNAWILAWDAHALAHEPTHLFQAPIFHPLPDALAFSENLLLPAALVAPATLLGGPVLGYNLALLGSLVASGLGVQLLVRRYSGDRLAAFVGGALFAVGAHRWFRLAHLHAQVTPFLPVAFLALDRFWERRTFPRALLLGLMLALQGLCSVYLGAITATGIVVAVAVGFLGGLRWRDLLPLTAGAALAAGLLLPVAAPYFRMRQFEGKEWSREDIAAFAATPESYAASATSLYGPWTERHADEERTREPLFPGLVPLAFGVLGLVVAPRRVRVVALAVSVVAVLISLGPNGGPYSILHEHVIFFRGIRALNRFSLLPVFALSVLAGLALSGRRRTALLALLFGLAEASVVPVGYGLYSPPSAASRWLAGRPGAVIAMPLASRDTEAMLEGIAHFRPLVNGDSGFVPRPYVRERELLGGPLSAEGLRFLRAAGVGHVVSRDDLPLPLAVRFDGDRIYEVPGGEPAHPVSASGTTAVAVLWGAGGATLDLGVPRAVSRIVFEPSDGAWVDQPVLKFSEDGLHWSGVRGSASLADAACSLLRDPRGGLAEVRFDARAARFVRLDPALPVDPGEVRVGP